MAEFIAISEAHDIRERLEKMAKEVLEGALDGGDVDTLERIDAVMLFLEGLVGDAYVRPEKPKYHYAYDMGSGRLRFILNEDEAA